MVDFKAKTEVLRLARSNYPKLKGQNKEYLIQQIKDIKSGARDNGQTVMMKPIVQGLGDAEIEALADYLS